MPSYLCIGRERNDYGLMVDFHKRRAIVKANTAWIEGIPLEEIESGQSELKQGLVLICRDWKNVYFLNHRKSWTDEDYFKFAERIMTNKGITKP